MIELNDEGLAILVAIIVGNTKMDVKDWEWLDLDEQGLPYYLYFLSLRFSISPDALAYLRKVAQLLEQDPDYWYKVVSRPLWRNQLVGCYALLITQNTNYLSALIE